MGPLACQMLKVKLFQEAPKFRIPVYFFVGRNDHTTGFSLTEAYFHKLIAPRKELIWFENSGHHPHLEEPEKFADRLVAIAESGGMKKPFFKIKAKKA